MYVHDGITLVLKLSNTLSATAAIWLALAMDHQLQSPGVPFRWSELEQVVETGWTRGKCRRAAKRAAGSLLSIPAASTYLVDVDAVLNLAELAAEARAESIIEKQAADAEADPEPSEPRAESIIEQAVARAESITEPSAIRAESITEQRKAARNRSNTNATQGCRNVVPPTEVVLGTAGRPAGAPMHEETAPTNRLPDGSSGEAPAANPVLERLREFGLRTEVIAWAGKHRQPEWIELRLARVEEMVAAGRAKDPPALLTYLLRSDDDVRPPSRSTARRGWTLEESVEVFRQRQVEREAAAAESPPDPDVHPALAAWANLSSTKVYAQRQLEREARSAQSVVHPALAGWAR